ncbi:hypothetical protein [Haloechinothrix salitolerans]|uniref:Condensation domain-containing protein n=1 Tax=Haloechinothrix salitolerans TaxID=926830 RepID=A0ABW2BU07_9PSEU
MTRTETVLAHGGDTSVSWSILLQARLTHPVDPDKVAQRLVATMVEHPHLGPAPDVTPVTEATLGSVRTVLADTPYHHGDPLVRVAVGESEPLLLLAAHHSAVDGLGLLALLGRALDVPVASSVAGLSANVAATSLARAAARRLADAVLRPTARIAPGVGLAGDRGIDPSATFSSTVDTVDGDTLVAVRTPEVGLRTPTLTAAVARTVAGWNRSHRRENGRMVAGIGASRRAGGVLDPVDASAYLLLPVGQDTDAERIGAALAHTPIEPEPPGTPLVRTVCRLARPLTDRIAATFLVSNVGSVSAAGRVTELAFFPIARGGSGVAFGAVTAAGTTTVTMRTRRSHFDTTTAAGFLTDVMRHFPGK